MHWLGGRERRQEKRRPYYNEERKLMRGQKWKQEMDSLKGMKSLSREISGG